MATNNMQFLKQSIQHQIIACAPTSRVRNNNTNSTQAPSVQQQPIKWIIKAKQAVKEREYQKLDNRIERIDKDYSQRHLGNSIPINFKDSIKKTGYAIIDEEVYRWNGLCDPKKNHTEQSYVAAVKNHFVGDPSLKWNVTCLLMISDHVIQNYGEERIAFAIELCKGMGKLHQRQGRPQPYVPARVYVKEVFCRKLDELLYYRVNIAGLLEVKKSKNKKLGAKAFREDVLKLMSNINPISILPPIPIAKNNNVNDDNILAVSTFNYKGTHSSINHAQDMRFDPMYCPSPPLFPFNNFNDLSDFDDFGQEDDGFVGPWMQDIDLHDAHILSEDFNTKRAVDAAYKI